MWRIGPRRRRALTGGTTPLRLRQTPTGKGEELVRTIIRLAFAMTILAATLGQYAHGQGNAVYLATYVEVIPNAVAPGTTLLKRYRDLSRNDDGNLRFDVFAEVARPNRFVIVEAWRDKAALDAYGQTVDTTQFEEKLKAIQDAPSDRRVTNALYLGQGANENRAGAIYAVTHIDVIPPGTAACMEALKVMSVDTAKDPGNISYEVLQQADRSNHFTVVEEWTNMNAANAHAMAAHTRAFREKLMPFAGALYDERFYKALN
jgi:quinol monooxygenase YgiN